MTRGLASLRDRSVAEGERRAAVAAVLAFLIAVAVLSGTRGASRVLSTPGHIATPAVAHPPILPIRYATSTALRFLSGYLSYSYRRRPPAGIKDASPALIESLADRPPRITVPARARLPRVLALHLSSDPSGQLVVDATLNDGGIVDYTIGLLLARQRGHLVVSKVESR